MLSRFLAAAGLLALAGPAMAEDCRLALVLALDVSSSVDAAEDRLQREGLARALLAPEVMQAFFVAEPVALYAFEWSGEIAQAKILPSWQLVEDEEDLVRIASTIAGSPRLLLPDPPHSRTAVGAALVHAAEALNQAPRCQARMVDVAGDGWSNEGVEPDEVYASRTFDGLTVNGLVVTGSRFDGQVVGWFRDTLLHGPGAFLVLADGYEDYERAMTTKLLRELELPLVSGEVRPADAG